MPRLVENHESPYSRLFTFPKWNGYVSVLQEPRLMRYLEEFRGWTKEDHLSKSILFMVHELSLREKVGEKLTELEKKYGRIGSFLSGGMWESFPQEERVKVWELWGKINFYHDASLSHWIASGKRSHTWRDMRASNGL